MKALVVDDCEDLCFVISLLLKTKGFEVYSFYDGYDAFRFLSDEKIKIDLMITDYDMPRMNGGQLIESLLEAKINMEKIIILSGVSSNEQKLQKMLTENKNIIFINKLISTEELLHHINS